MAKPERKDVPNWELVDGTWIMREYSFKNFKAAIAFVNKVADLAEEKNHHPNIDIDYNKVTLRLTTHSANQLTPLDFELAIEIENVYEGK